MTRIGVESCYGFGDCLFNAPLIQAISNKYNQPINVAVRSNCADAFENLPFVNKIIHIPHLHHGYAALQNIGCTAIFQLTQNLKFEEFKAKDQNHSLIDTPLLTGRQLEIPDFNQKPIFIPTPEELAVGTKYNDPLPNIAIETVYTSGQSWADHTAFQMILDKHRDTHRKCWLSNQGAPEFPLTDNMLRWTRRQIICALQYCEIFYSVGSGFFCAAMALPPEMQPRKIICLWNDSYYKYEKRIAELQLHPNIIWVHNHSELAAAL